MFEKTLASFPSFEMKFFVNTNRDVYETESSCSHNRIDPVVAVDSSKIINVKSKNQFSQNKRLLCGKTYLPLYSNLICLISEGQSPTLNKSVCAMFI